MSRDEETRGLDEIRRDEMLLRLFAMAEIRQPDSPFYAERLSSWLESEVNSPDRRNEGWSSDRIARAAERMRGRALAKRLGVVSEGRAHRQPSPYAGTAPQLLEEGLLRGVAPYVDLAAAAGAGRALWDEPCHEVVVLPEQMPSGRYVAIGIAGDSMEPAFHRGDTLLVKLGNEAQRDTVILARLPGDDGYVVKRVARATRASLVLHSLNPAYAPIVLEREAGSVVGTVLLRWCEHEQP